MCDIGVGDEIKIFYEDVIEVRGKITNIQVHDDNIMLHTHCRDYTGNGMYSGDLAVKITKDVISFCQIMKNNDNKTELLRIIYPKYNNYNSNECWHND